MTKKTFFLLLTCILFTGVLVSCSVWGISHKKHEPIEAASKRLNIAGPFGKLAAILETPALSKDQFCPIVILMHGFGSNKNDHVCSEIAKILKDKGIASIRFDFDGHAESEGSFQNMTIAKEVQDAKAVYDYVSKLDYVTKIGIQGHSQGGLICALLAKDKTCKIETMVIMAPALCVPDDARAGKNLGVRYDPNHIPEAGIRIGSNILGKKFIEEAQKMHLWEEIKEYDKPVCILHGSQDPIVPVRYSMRAAEIYPHAKLHVFDGDDHGFSKNFEAACQEAADFLATNLKQVEK